MGAERDIHASHRGTLPAPSSSAFSGARYEITNIEGRITPEQENKVDQKYISLRGSGSHLYLFPGMDFGSIHAFCEGVFGAIVAAQQGVAVASIQGFRRYRMTGGKQPLEELDGVDFDGRTIPYIPDVDDPPKNEVMDEAPHAARWLIEHQNGVPTIALLPDGKDLDQYLLTLPPAGQVKALRTLVYRAVDLDAFAKQREAGQNSAGTQSFGSFDSNDSTPTAITYNKETTDTDETAKNTLRSNPNTPLSGSYEISHEPEEPTSKHTTDEPTKPVESHEPQTDENDMLRHFTPNNRQPAYSHDQEAHQAPHQAAHRADHCADTSKRENSEQTNRPASTHQRLGSWIPGRTARQQKSQPRNSIEGPQTSEHNVTYTQTYEQTNKQTGDREESCLESADTLATRLIEKAATTLRILVVLIIGIFIYSMISPATSKMVPELPTVLLIPGWLSTAALTFVVSLALAASAPALIFLYRGSRRRRYQDFLDGNWIPGEKRTSVERSKR